MFSRRTLPVLIGLAFLAGIPLMGQVGCSDSPEDLLSYDGSSPKQPVDGCVVDGDCDDGNACTLNLCGARGCLSICMATNPQHQCCDNPACRDWPACGRDVGVEGLYGTLHMGWGNTSILVLLDPDTGALLETIGDVGYAVNGLTWDRTTRTLYATTTYWDPLFPSGLITISRATGAGTPVGTGSGLNQVNNPTADSAGNLYGWTEWYYSGGWKYDDPVRWDKVAGTATAIGLSGISTWSHGLAFDAADVLYLVNGDSHIYTINTVTGAATYTGVSFGYTAHHGVFHPVTGRYYGIDTTSGAARNLRIGNIATGVIEATLPTVDRLHTLAFVVE